MMMQGGGKEGWGVEIYDIGAGFCPLSKGGFAKNA